MANDVLMAPGAFDADAEQIRRRMAYAQALQAQSQQTPQGQMVSGHYVAPSWTQHAANLLRAYAGRKGEDQALSDYRGLADQRRTEGAADVSKMAALLRGSPENAPGDGMGPTMPATGPDLAGALSMAAQSRNPALQGMAPALFASMMPKVAEGININGQLVDKFTGKPMGQQVSKPAEPYTLAPGAVRYGANGAQVAAAPQAPFTLAPGAVRYGADGSQVAAAPQAPFTLTPGAQRFDGGGNPVAAVGDQNKPFNQDGTPNTAYQDFKVREGAARGTKISVDNRNFSTQENEQSKTYGKTLGEIRSAVTQAGFEAPNKLAQLARMEELLKGVDGGGASPTIAQVSSLANSFGIKLDPKLGVKQAAEALSREMAGSLRKPGTGPMTDKDFDNFLAQVPSLSKTAEGRAQITKTMRAAIERDQRAAAFARDYAQKNRGVIDDGFFDAMAKFYADSPIVMPQMPETNQQGAAMVMPKGFRVIR